MTVIMIMMVMMMVVVTVMLVVVVVVVMAIRTGNNYSSVNKATMMNSTLTVTVASIRANDGTIGRIDTVVEWCYEKGGHGSFVGEI